MQPAAGGEYDVVIVGGGPGGSTLGTLLRKYNPELKVLILEKERFPREHVGESQLPPISAVLIEMGCWDKVEAANFPIKIGATYTWGNTVDPWDFEFLPLDAIKEDEPRPAKYEGWRQQTAFQVDRAIYDKILLDQARLLGCEVREETRVAGLERALEPPGDPGDGIGIEPAAARPAAQVLENWCLGPVAQVAHQRLRRTECKQGTRIAHHNLRISPPT